MSEKLYKVLLILLITSIFLAVPTFYLISETDKNLEVLFLDVGQGDAELIKTPFGQNILVDGGPDNVILKRLGEELPLFDKKIDLMILTHPHADHVTGLIDVLRNYEVKKILYTGAIHTAPAYLEWLNIVKEKNIPLVIIDRPQTVKLGENCEIKIIYPFKNLAGKSFENLNNSSIVFKLIYGKTSFLFTGDAEREVEEEILKDGVALKSDVLKVSHHGSSSGVIAEFLKEVSPQIAVIEVGEDNEFGHPTLRTIKKLERSGAKIFRTDQDGTIKLKSDGEIIKLADD